MSIKPLQQVGDTIVEVLIVIVVMGVVVSAGYGIAVRSLQSTQLAQEKSYALKIAEGQLESLKAKASTTPAILARADGFCLDTTTLAEQTITAPSPTPTLEAENFASYPNCKKDPNDPANSCASYCYYFGLKKVGDNAFTASVRWNGPRSNRQQIQLSYRLYE